MSYVTGTLTGGLGNQLFVLNATLSIASRLNFEAKVSKENYVRESRNIRNLEVESILDFLNVKMVSEEYADSFMEKDSFTYEPTIYEITKPTKLVGYFQNYRYFDSSSERLREVLIKFGKDESVPVDKSHEFIHVHYRRGDYLSNPVATNYHGILNDTYFIDSVAIARAIWGDLPVLIFSDSLDDALLLSSKIPNSKVFYESSKNSLETLLTLSNCTALIASNSSFSWWAAYLGEFNYGNVFFPYRWTRYHLSKPEILFPNWINLPDDGHFNYSLKDYD